MNPYWRIRHWLWKCTETPNSGFRVYIVGMAILLFFSRCLSTAMLFRAYLTIASSAGANSV
jgi:hypothetical protein